MKDYSIYNKLKLNYLLIKDKIYEFFHPNMSYTLNIYTDKDKYKNILYDNKIKDSMILINYYNSPIRKKYKIPIGDINKNNANTILSLINDYKDEINFDDNDGELYFISNKKEDLN